MSHVSQAILREILRHIKESRVIATDQRTYAGYKQIHDVLHLKLKAKTYGDSLKVQGLSDLAEWTLKNKLPAITGLIVDRTRDSDSYLRPGNGYFELFSKSPDDFAWWEDQVAQSLARDWQEFLEPFSELAPPKAVDLAPPAEERVKTTTYRILRDTELARHVKELHDYRCQLCGHTIELPNGARYAEAHHIKPLGAPHNGPDVIGNILCLCPNHHAELDFRARRLDLKALRLHEAHPIDQRFVLFHNSLTE